MKNRLATFFRLARELVTGVPGWPDAPWPARARRAAPLALPVIAALLLAGWNFAVRDPAWRAERAAFLPLLALEDEIAALRLDCSDQEAADLVARAAAASRRLLDSPADVSGMLPRLKSEAASRGWTGEFQAGDASGPADATATGLLFLPVRARLSAHTKDPAIFRGLLDLLGQFYAAEKRIELTRVAVRADEQGRYVAELNLRLACLRPHEKTP